MSETVYYAIGDVHGELEKLDRLLDLVRKDARRQGGDHKIVFLGDLIDRGPDNRGVVMCAMAATASGEALTLRGNHEELMLTAHVKWDTIGVHFWASNGGDETIASYKRANGDHDDWRDAIDREHLDFLRTSPVIVQDEARKLVSSRTSIRAASTSTRAPALAGRSRAWFLHPRSSRVFCGRRSARHSGAAEGRARNPGAASDWPLGSGLSLREPRNDEPKPDPTSQRQA